MATVYLKLSLPEKLRQEAEKAGLLTPKAIERLLRDEIRRLQVDRFFAAVDRLAVLDLLPLSEAEIESEIHEARKLA